jgi:hypothetical protein
MACRTSVRGIATGPSDCGSDIRGQLWGAAALWTQLGMGLEYRQDKQPRSHKRIQIWQRRELVRVFLGSLEFPTSSHLQSNA